MFPFESFQTIESNLTLCAADLAQRAREPVDFHLLVNIKKGLVNAEMTDVLQGTDANLLRPVAIAL